MEEFLQHLIDEKISVVDWFGKNKSTEKFSEIFKQEYLMFERKEKLKKIKSKIN